MSANSRMLAYSSLLAMNAGWVNAVAILIMAVPVGNLTGITTQIGMDRAHPWRYESHVLFAILLGFLIGAAIAGALLASKRMPIGNRHAAVLSIQASLLLLAAAGIEESDVKSLILGSGIEETAVQAFLAAAALGLQNGLTSSFRGMAVRTTHFTGTVTDLGLMLGRSRQEGIDKWKAAILSATLLLFLTGAVVGLMAGARIGGHALVVPATICLVLAAIGMVRSRRRREQPITAEPVSA
ncbi:YoaK family protein [Mycobacterium sp. TY814]|uniref:YoaK family protein n=1 Tax=unclassified Mycobacterium TaxID=2642494 RepID=UPI00274262E7|nr:YoaK family protein [Mycobacterium sp. TY814]MDP7722732.1 YoaK family protein [Mycobacterium sp. TY814]